MRTEFGFQRTIVDGPVERLNCKYMPSYLIPADLERIAKSLGKTVEEWAMENLLASPGATLARVNPQTRSIVPYQVRTLVPARNANGHCLYYQEDTGHCQIHAVSPFGCAFFDTTMSRSEADRRTLAGLAAVKEDWATNGPYSQIWTKLHAAGKTAMSATECRERIDIALLRLRRKGKI
jgi:Fe-S-cluster containining protein